MAQLSTTEAARLKVLQAKETKSTAEEKEFNDLLHKQKS